MSKNRDTSWGFIIEIIFWIVFLFGGIVWMMRCFVDDGKTEKMNAPILEIDQAKVFLDQYRNNKHIFMMSGGFDPLHPGHIGYIQWISRTYIHVFSIVVVNGDSFLSRKKGRPFMSIEDRCSIVSAIRGVDLVVPFESPTKSQTVCEALEELMPDSFVKGGDRCDAETIPEWETCKRLSIEIITDAGPTKKWSSSSLISDWMRHGQV